MADSVFPPGSPGGDRNVPAPGSPFAGVRSRERGAILIIAIGVLTLLAILGATFANLMRLEKQATQNYLDSQEMDLLLDSALEHVIADLRGAQNWWSFTPYRAPWLYKLVHEDDLAHGLETVDSPRVGSWQVMSRRQKNEYRYKTKVIDTSAQININGKQDTLGRMLNFLAAAIERSPRLKHSKNPFRLQRTGELVTGRQIIEFRNKLEGNRFRSKTQIRELIGQENFEILKDFITVESYVDPYTYRSDDGVDEIVEQGALRAGGAVGGTQNFQNLVESPLSRLSPEPRSPININTAPEEVLIACIQGIGARRPFPYSRLSYATIDQGAETAGHAVVGQEERDNVMPRGVWVYSDSTGLGFDYEKARSITQRIIAQRKQTPFVAWSTGDRAQPGGFAEFINDLESTFFPPPERALAIDPRMPPNDRRVDNEIRRSGSPEMSRVWNKGHEAIERSLRDQTGLPFHGDHAFYYEMMKGALIANFNPNTRINRYNPNRPAYVAVDKSDLVRMDTDRLTPRKGHTTEFCFDTNGIYEVTALGEIAEALAPSAGTLPGGSPTVAAGYGGAAEGTQGYRSLYRRPMRTVVKVFDILRHTNQLHFEKTFSTGDRSSRSNRRDVVTFPDPMVALTDAMSQGSMRDGSVQLAGLNDAMRLRLPPASRFQLYQSPQTIIMAHGFHDRDDTSYSQLRRLGRVPSTQLADELLKVLNAPFSRKGGQRYRECYNRVELTQTGLGFTNDDQLNNMPLVGVDASQGSATQGSDLFPDGYHQGSFRTSNLGGRFVYLPAHERMGFSSKSGMGRQVGAGQRVNVSGNVPYYDGGMAFWVKFEFDGDDPVFSGLIGCTQVIEDVGQNPKDSEGTQFYIFKNTQGDLRIVRMYYHQAYPDGGGEGGATVGTDAGALWPPVDTGNDDGGETTPGQNPIIDFLDQQKKVARSDILLSVRKFKAREWHHIAVDWNDRMENQPLQVHIDFERVQEGGPYVRHDPQGDVPKAWVRLNCRRPRDELFIGGFVRSQNVSDSGVFKWFTNIADALGPGKGVVPVAQSMKRILANATIDELITYEGSFHGVRNYYGSGGAQGYFTNRSGMYANVFEVPLPPEVDYVTLRSFDWTAYYPSFFTTREGQVQRVITQPSIECQVFPGRENITRFGEPWRGARRTANNPVAGRRLHRREAKGLLGRNAELVYEFTIPPGRVMAGPLAGGSVQTPVLDDVTLTYFLPDPKILLQEEAEDPRPRT